MTEPGPDPSPPVAASDVAALRARLGRSALGAEAFALLERLLPLPRSLTGDGVRATLAVLAEYAPLVVHEEPSGSRVLDWVVPDEWVLRRATLHGPDGAVLADSDRSPIEVVAYSRPVAGRMSLDELRPHLRTEPRRPHAVPYRTSFFRDDWGFCLPDAVVRSLAPGDYTVHIDADRRPGSLTWAEAVLPATGPDVAPSEILLATHTCHPNLANDNTSGLAVVALAARLLAGVRRRHAVRVVLGPGTLGALCFLARYRARVASGEAGPIVAGLVVAGVGDPGPLSYKRSQRGDTLIDRAAAHVLAHRAHPGEARLLDWVPYGYDERQYNSPGFDLPVGRLSRTPFGEYPEYHTSDDDLRLVRPAALGDTLDALLGVVEVVDGDRCWRSTNPDGEPQLGRRGLYGDHAWLRSGDRELTSLWVLNQADGTRSLLDVAERSGIAFGEVAEAAAVLAAAGLLVDGEQPPSTAPGGSAAGPSGPGGSAGPAAATAAKEPLP